MQKNVIEYLEHSYTKFPNKLAYVDAKGEISFESLRSNARRLANYLISKGIVKCNIGLIIDRNIDALICFYACMYSNNCYVPMDIELGKARISSIISESKLSILLMASELIKPIDVNEIMAMLPENAQMLNLSQIAEELESYDSMEIELSIRKVQASQISTDPVYIVYTSGSSGKPKGVIANHINVIDYIDALGEALGFSEENVFANQSPLYIDACLKDILSSLKYGATNYIVPKSLFMFPVKLVEFLNENKVNTICWVVSALSIISSMNTFDRVVPEHLHTVAFGGERFDKLQLAKWIEVLPNARFYNLYGPTEATGMSMYYEVEKPFEVEKPLYVGKAFKNTEVFLVNHEVDPPRVVQAGEEGYVYIRGLCVTMGYFGDFDRTRQSFVQNPLNSNYHEIVYNTGDIGYYDKCGRLVFKGRADNQIKHMGYRIELAEIEHMALKSEQVIQAICVYMPEENKINMYYVGDCSERDLKVFISDQLPRYMIPHKFYKIDRMPLTNSGKIDKESLKQIK